METAKKEVTREEARKEARAAQKPQTELILTETNTLVDEPLHGMGTVPEANRPAEFSNPPGVPLPDETKLYYPNRFILEPNLDDYQDADLVYSVHEDGSYTVLSEKQQTEEWQTANHLPAMNLLYRVGGEVVPPKEKKTAAKKEAK